MLEQLEVWLPNGPDEATLLALRVQPASFRYHGCRWQRAVATIRRHGALAAVCSWAASDAGDRRASAAIARRSGSARWRTRSRGAVRDARRSGDPPAG